MTRKDKWCKRMATSKYWFFCNKVKLLGVKLPVSGAEIIFYIAIPRSWSKKKAAMMNGKAHQQKPDLDNLIKALCDAVYGDDACVWEITARKLWADEGAIEII